MEEKKMPYLKLVVFTNSNTYMSIIYIYPKGIFFINGQEKTENLIGRDKPLERRAHSG